MMQNKKRPFHSGKISNLSQNLLTILYKKFLFCLQSIALLDQLDKDVNLFSMRIREWYSYHFPELVKIVNDNYMFSKCVKLLKNRKVSKLRFYAQNQMLDPILTRLSNFINGKPQLYIFFEYRKQWKNAMNQSSYPNSRKL